MSARPSALVTGAAADVGSLGFRCRGVHAEATLIGDVLVSFLVRDEPAEELVFECSELACPTTPDRGRLRYLLERQRGR